jgi:hypothetical protein
VIPSRPFFASHFFPFPSQLKKSQDEVVRLTELLERSGSNQSDLYRHSDDREEMTGESKGHDSLEISRAVAATEPHVSQLMEDLEIISKEKEKLGKEKEIAERKCNVAISIAEKQKVFISSQS